jgi:hypothetical protein
VIVEALKPHRHDPPPGWSPETFEKLTEALAAAIVAVIRRVIEEPDEAPGVEAREDRNGR